MDCGAIAVGWGDGPHENPWDEPLVETHQEGLSFQQRLQNFDHSDLKRDDIPQDQKDLINAFKSLLSDGAFDAESRFTRLAGGDSDVAGLAASVAFRLRFDRADYRALNRVLMERGEHNEILASFSQAPAMRLAQLEEPVTSKVNLTSTGVPKCDVKLGKQTVPFIFDTGALSLLSRSLADRLGVTDLEGQFSLGTSTEHRVMATAAVVPYLEVGRVAVWNLLVVVVPDALTIMRPDGLAPFSVDAILGWNLSRELRTEIDFERMRFTIEISRGQRVDRPNLLWLGYPLVGATHASGLPLTFGLDTGSRNTSVLHPILDKIPFENRFQRRETIGGLGGVTEIDTDIIPNFQWALDDVLFTHPEVRREMAPDAFFLTQDGTIGVDVAQGRTMIVDYRSGLFSVR